jgi:type II secretory pathway component PulF
MPQTPSKRRGTTKSEIAAKWEYFVVQYDLGKGHRREIPVLAPSKKVALLCADNFNDEPLLFKKLSAGDKALSKAFCRKTPTRTDIVAFVDFLQRGLSKRFPTQDALQTSLVAVKEPVLRGMIGRMREIVSSGDGYLADALAEFPDSFSDSHVRMLRAAQESSGAGGIGEMMRAISHALQTAAKLRKQFIGKMAYPVGVFALGLCAAIALLFFALPGAVESAIEDGREVWAISHYPYLVVRYIKDTPLLWSLPFVALIMLFVQWKVIKESEFIQRKLCAVPKLGPTLITLAIVNPLRSLSMTQKASIHPSARMAIACDSTANFVVKDFFSAVGKQVSSGSELSVAIAKERWRIGDIGDNLAAQATVSKRTGEGSDLLDSLADTIEEDAAARIKNLALILEPITIFSVLILVFAAFASVYSVQLQVLFEALSDK